MDMVKATSLWNQLTGCFSLNQNFIVNIAGSGRRVGRPGSVRRHVFVHGIWPETTSTDCSDLWILQPRVPWQHLSTVVLLWRMWSSWVSNLDFSSRWKTKIIVEHFHMYSPNHHSHSPLSSEPSIWRFTLLFCRVRYANAFNARCTWRLAARLFFLFKPITF